MKATFYNTLTATYKEKAFHFLPFLTWQKLPSWADFYQYKIRFGWLCFAISITIKDEAEKYDR